MTFEVSLFTQHILQPVSMIKQSLHVNWLSLSRRSSYESTGLSETGWLNTEPFRVIPLLPLVDLKLCAGENRAAVK